MHIVPMYYLPLGVNVINTSVLVQNQLQTAKKAHNFLSAIPQLHPMQNITFDCSVIPVNPYNKYWNDFMKSDLIAMKEPHVFIRISSLDTALDLKHSNEFALHERSDEIVQATFKGYLYSRASEQNSQVVESIWDPSKDMKDAPFPVISTDNIKLVILTHGLKEPKDRFMREHTKKPLNFRPGATPSGTASGTAPPTQMQISSIILHPMVKITKKELTGDPISDLNRLLTRLKNQNSLVVNSQLKTLPTIEGADMPETPVAHKQLTDAENEAAEKDKEKEKEEAADEEQPAEETELAIAFKNAAERARKELSNGGKGEKPRNKYFFDDEEDLQDALEAIVDSDTVNAKDFKTMQIGIKRLQEVADALFIENEHQTFALQASLSVTYVT